MNQPQTTTERVSLSRVLLPTEHGGWAFLAEPVFLGSLVAFSWAGLAIALAAVAGFLARQPLRLFVMDRRRLRRHPRTAVAEQAFAGSAVAGALALAAGGLLAKRPFLVPLGLAAPLAALALALDLDRRAREVAAEVAAAVALASVASAIALAGGWSMAHALGLWGILAARAVPTILYVRARLRLDRREPAGVAGAIAAHALAIAGTALLAGRGVVPWSAAGAITLLAARCAYGLSAVRPAMTTKQIGISEAIFGAITVFATVWGAMTEA